MVSSSRSRHCFPGFPCLDSLGQAFWNPYASGHSLDLGPIISLRVSVFSPSGASGQELWSGQKEVESRVSPGRWKNALHNSNDIMLTECLDYMAFITPEAMKETVANRHSTEEKQP